MRPKTPLLRLRNLSRNYGQVEAVRPLDLDISRGDFFAILGPSGCGKTTLLRMIGGFITPTTGTVEIAGADVTALGPEKRPTNMVFQGLGLFPHMTVRQNVAYGLRIARRAALRDRRHGAGNPRSRAASGSRRDGESTSFPAASSRESPSPGRW